MRLYKKPGLLEIDTSPKAAVCRLSPACLAELKDLSGKSISLDVDSISDNCLPLEALLEHSTVNVIKKSEKEVMTDRDLHSETLDSLFYKKQNKRLQVELEISLGENLDLEAALKQALGQAAEYKARLEQARKEHTAAVKLLSQHNEDLTSENLRLLQRLSELEQAERSKQSLRVIDTNVEFSRDESEPSVADERAEGSQADIRAVPATRVARGLDTQQDREEWTGALVSSRFKHSQRCLRRNR